VRRLQGSRQQKTIKPNFNLISHQGLNSVSRSGLLYFFLWFTFAQQAPFAKLLHNNTTTMSLPPVDYFISSVRYVEHALSPVLQPIEKAVAPYVPFAYLKSVTSAHAKRLPLMNPIHVALIVVMYLSIVLAGQKIMNHFKRVDMFYLPLFHNFSMVALSAYMFVEVLRQAYLEKYTLFANPLDESLNGWPVR
jgi:hypothetical protein